eukprot:EG_transcript_14369
MAKVHNGVAQLAAHRPSARDLGVSPVVLKEGTNWVISNASVTVRSPVQPSGPHPAGCAPDGLPAANEGKRLDSLASDAKPHGAAPPNPSATTLNDAVGPHSTPILDDIQSLLHDLLNRQVGGATPY